jgi:hypothetical protein
MVSDRFKSILYNRWNHARYLNGRANNDRLDLKTFVDNQFVILYSDAKLQNVSGTVLLEFYKSNGFGDLMIGYKCMKALREDFPPHIKLVVVSETPDDVRIICGNYLNDNDVDLLDVRNITEYLDSCDIDRTFLVTFALGSEIPSDDLARLHPRTLYVDEYNGWRVSEEIDPKFEHRLIPGFGIGRNGILTSGINIMRNPVITTPKFPNEYYFGYISEYHPDTETLYKYLICILLLNRNSMKTDQYRSVDTESGSE